MRLSTVLDQVGVANIHALKIDLEGIIRWVLEDFFEMAPAALRPGLIICEVGRDDPCAIVPFLQTRGYQVSARTWSNAVAQRSALQRPDVGRGGLSHDRIDLASADGVR